MLMRIDNVLELKPNSIDHHISSENKDVDERNILYTGCLEKNGTLWVDKKPAF